MNNISECSYMELWCRQRANDDPRNSWRWLGQAERWRELGQRRANESLRQRRQMTAGPLPVICGFRVESEVHGRAAFSRLVGLQD
jgi:hypothetical protein